MNAGRSNAGRSDGGSPRLRKCAPGMLRCPGQVSLPAAGCFRRGSKTAASLHKVYGVAVDVSQRRRQGGILAAMGTAGWLLGLTEGSRGGERGEQMAGLRRDEL